MSAPKWMSVCLLTCFLSCSVSQAPEEVNVKSGEDVLLHCQGPKDVAIKLLAWIKSDVKSDGYVFFFREKQSYEDYQHPHFHGRVMLRDPKMKDGDFSVILKNVSMIDTGAYECRVGKNHLGHSKRATPELISSVTLNVDDAVSPLDKKTITAEIGDHITLPCQGLSSTPITTVKWTVSGRKKHVYLYPDNWSVPHNQHSYYKEWVELKDSEMKDGDASLILKDVVNAYSGTYECWINHRKTNQRIDLYVTPGGGDKGGRVGGEKDGGDNDRCAWLGTSLSFVFFLTVIIIVVFVHRRCFHMSTTQMNE